MIASGTAGRGRGVSSALGGELGEVAQHLAAQAEEIRRVAELMEMVARLARGAGSTPEAVSYALAHAVIGQPGGQAAATRPGPDRGPDGGGRAGAAVANVALPQRRLWKDTPFVVIQAATARSYGRPVLCALGITADGHKRVLGYRWDTTSMQVAATAFIEDLFERGVKAPSDSRLLWVTDGGQALDQAIAHRYPGAHRGLCRHAFSEHVLAYVRKSAAEGEVREALGRALRHGPDEIRRGLDRLAQSLTLAHPGAAQAVREGIEGVLVVPSLCPDPVLSTSLASVATLRTAVAEAVRLGRQTDGGEKDPLAAGSELFERRTRRILGYEALTALERALGRPGRAA
jgi:hypothetical protein